MGNDQYRSSLLKLSVSYQLSPQQNLSYTKKFAKQITDKKKFGLMKISKLTVR